LTADIARVPTTFLIGADGTKIQLLHMKASDTSFFVFITRTMNWFGFGFNGFGQIRPADVTCKVNTPVLISDVCRSDCRVRASWSSRAHVHHSDGKW